VTPTAAPMRVHIDAWDPGYGTSADGNADLDGTSAAVRLDVELASAAWRPLDPPPGATAPEQILFVDGVRRIDARAWLTPDGAVDAYPAIAASYAAGVVCCSFGRAELVYAEMHRGLFTAAPGAQGLPTSAGEYPLRPARDSTSDELSLALQRRLADAEVAVSADARRSLEPGRADPDSDLLVVDGPLRGRTHLPRVLGLVKTHRAAYLPEDRAPIVADLGPRQRTPVFLLGTSWDRYTWYLRLPCPAAHAWAGVVRVECPADLDPADAVALAGMSQDVLCRYASCEYKDARAPQNLYPIGGLERLLRRRLGDARVLYRALRAAAA
jgi:hypothetical protein